MLSAGSNEIIDNEEAQIEILLQELADPAKYSNGTEVRLLEFLNPGVARPQKSTRVSRESASPDHICKGLSSTLRSRLALRAVKTVTEALAGYSIRGNRSSNRSGLGTDAICGAAGGNSAIGERDDSPPNAAATHGHDLWIRTLAKCGLQSLEFIGSPPGLMNIAKFDREKAACNIAMRLIDLGYVSDCNCCQSLLFPTCSNFRRITIPRCKVTAFA